jgi:hypothetical protein
MKNELMLEMIVMPRRRDALIEFIQKEKEYHKGFDPSKSIFDYPVILWDNKRDKSSRYYFDQPNQWLGKVTDIAFDYDPVCTHDVCRIRFFNQTERNKQFYEWMKDHISNVFVTPSFIADPIYSPSEYQDLMGCPIRLQLSKVAERIAIRRIMGFVFGIR